MSDSQEKSDDLIAELAKLMASNAQGSESEPKPTVIKLAPLSESTPPPIRIPGMDMPAGSAMPTPTIRIPGMERPAGVDAPAPAAEALPAPKPQAAPDPGRAPGTVLPPLDQTPQPASPPRVEPAVPPAQPQSTPAAEPEPFKFDFGFGANGGAASDKDTNAPKPQEQAVPATAAAHDPIADLIAAELDAAQAVPVTPEPAKAEPAPAAAVFPPSVEAVPARNFGNTTAGQAPVLVARPAGTAPRATPAPVAFRPLLPAKPAESDKFAVAPVFGLGGKPAPAASANPAPARPAPFDDEAKVGAAAADQPRHVPDPMDEIESLIGQAVRVELTGTDRPAVVAPPQPQAQRQAPAAPVVPPLTTAFAPRRAGLKDSEPQVRSAEAAILAAAAATGAEVGRISPPTGDDHPYKRSRIKAPKPANMFGGLRQYVGMAVAGTLLLAAGFGLYWVLGMGHGDTEAPILAADATPAKQAPVATAANSAEPARSVVFDEIDGVAAVDDAETLVSRDETADTSVAEVARVVTPEDGATESGLANRKVRTVTVRPDGTIVNGDEAVAGTEALPVERPNVPAVPGASVEPSDLLTAAAAEDPSGGAPVAGADPIAAAIAEGQAATTEAAPANLPVVEVAAVPTTETTPAVFDASLVAPMPMPRPVDRSALNAGTATSLDDLPLVDLNEPAAEPAAVVQPAATSGSGGAAYVQLSSQPSEADAQAAIQSAQSRWGALFNGNQLIVQRADLGAKGIKYRVRLPASSLQEATQICAAIKSNGGDCFATNG